MIETTITVYCDRCNNKIIKCHSVKEFNYKMTLINDVVTKKVSVCRKCILELIKNWFIKSNSV